MRRTSRRKLLRSGALLGGAMMAAAAKPLPDTPAAGKPQLDIVVLGAVRPGSLYAIHGDGSDTTALWQEAFAGIAAAGRGAILTSGQHLISRELTLPDVAAIEIAGEGDATLKKADPGRAFRIFSGEGLRTPLPTLKVRGLRFVGDWDQRPSQGDNDCRCIAVRGYHRVVFHDLTAEAFRNMTLTADDCDEVLVDGCRVLRSARDPINLTGSRFVKVINCTIQNAWDDAIAVHVPRDVVDDNRRYATIISNNQILQANGIKVLGGRDITITGNQIIAPNNYGIYLGRDAFWREGGVPHRNVIVADNIVGEMIPYEYLRGQGDVSAGIFFVDSGRALQSTRIRGNVITKYKPSGRSVRFSDWGFGPNPGECRMFTADGWIDPELIHGHQGKGTGIRILAANADDPVDIAIDANSFANLGQTVERRVER